MIKSFLILVATVFVVGCEARIHVDSHPSAGAAARVQLPQSSVVSTESPCDAERAEDAALYALPTHGFGYEDSVELALAHKKRVACIRGWALAQRNECVRNAYCKWLDYYDGKIDDQIVKINNHVDDLRNSEWDKEQKREQRLRAAYVIKTKFPTPKLECK